MTTGLYPTHHEAAMSVLRARDRSLVVEETRDGFRVTQGRERPVLCAVLGCRFTSWRLDRMCPRHEPEPT